LKTWTTKAHIDRTNGHYSFSVSTLDYDDDGWPDIFVACDSTPASLSHNRDGTFSDVAVVAGAASMTMGGEQAGMVPRWATTTATAGSTFFKTNSQTIPPRFTATMRRHV